MDAKPTGSEGGCDVICAGMVVPPTLSSWPPSAACDHFSPIPAAARRVTRVSLTQESLQTESPSTGALSACLLRHSNVLWCALHEETGER